MCKKIFLFLMLLGASFYNQAMFHHELKNIAIKSMGYNTAAMRAMSSEKKSTSTEIKCYQAVLGCCATIYCIGAMVTSLTFVSELTQESKRKKCPELIEEYSENKKKNKHQK